MLRAPESVIDPITGREVNWCKSSYTHAPTCTTTAEDVDYLILEPNRRRTPYVAVKVRPSLEYLIELQTAYGISNFF
ncbi:MAG: hypothetical protein AMJ63_17820 [Myxococcales bacterium SG8_38_1]|nr:MAG: hypothetical protein AMJ63_17820 [Myxococcales bacterium SG8_38_1]